MDIGDTLHYGLHQLDSFFKRLTGNIKAQANCLRIDDVSVHPSEHIIGTDFEQDTEAFTQHPLN